MVWFLCPVTIHDEEGVSPSTPERDPRFKWISFVSAIGGPPHME
jgi:hypothetical protein